MKNREAIEIIKNFEKQELKKLEKVSGGMMMDYTLCATCVANGPNRDDKD